MAADVFPGLFVRSSIVYQKVLQNDDENTNPSVPVVFKRRTYSGNVDSRPSGMDKQAAYKTGARKQEEPMPCLYDGGDGNFPNSVDNGGWQQCELRPGFRLTPAMFTVPTLFRRDGFVWSYTFLGDDGLWAVPRPYR